MATLMRAWQFSSATDGLEKNLHLNENAIIPQIQSPTDILIETISMSVNPVDYKIPELGLLSKAIIRTPASPGLDFAGRIADIGPKVTRFKKGQLVFGKLKAPTQFGTMAQYTVSSEDCCAVIPEGVDPDDAATAGVAGLTAFQSIVPNAKEGDKVFINGGSGGTGTFGIQIAKAYGCHVTASCSTTNVELCKRLGADDVIDYKTTDLCSALKEQGEVSDLVVDNVGTPANLYKASNHYLKPTGKFVQVGLNMSMSATTTLVSNLFHPGFLGGGKRKYELLSVKSSSEDLARLGGLMQEGKVKPIVAETFEFEDAPRAYQSLKTGRTKGKIVVHVSSKGP